MRVLDTVGQGLFEIIELWVILGIQTFFATLVSGK
jgi:hypothetical protein